MGCLIGSDFLEHLSNMVNLRIVSLFFTNTKTKCTGFLFVLLIPIQSLQLSNSALSRKKHEILYFDTEIYSRILTEKVWLLKLHINYLIWHLCFTKGKHSSHVTLLSISFPELCCFPALHITCKSIWIKATAKRLNVNVNVNIISLKHSNDRKQERNRKCDCTGDGQEKHKLITQLVIVLNLTFIIISLHSVPGYIITVWIIFVVWMGSVQVEHLHTSLCLWYGSDCRNSQALCSHCVTDPAQTEHQGEEWADVWMIKRLLSEKSESVVSAKTPQTPVYVTDKDL